MTSKSVYRKQKRIEFAKCCQKSNTLINKILRHEKRYGTKRLLAEFPTKINHYTVKRLQRKIVDTGSEENEKLFEQKYSIILVLCC